VPESGNGSLAFVSDDRRSQLEEIFSSGCPMRPASSLRGCGESGSFGAGRFSGARATAVVQIPAMAAKLGSGVHWDQAASTAFQISGAVLLVVLSLLCAN